MTITDQLVDGFGRVHTSLRISVTDRCNIRCFYCMPADQVDFRPREELLTFEEITRFACVIAKQGVNRLRLTGGEPLVRQGMPELIRMLAATPGVKEIAMTTNGILLADCATELRKAGLRRINISLDGLSEETFKRISRREGLHRVLEGIAAAQKAGFDEVKLNAIAIRGITENEIVPLGKFARKHRLPLRFIEFMPLDAEKKWDRERVLSGKDVRDVLSQEITELRPIARRDAGQPATDYAFVDDGTKIGFINSVTEPFCHACNRLRLTAEGQIRNCLFSVEEWDARAILRDNNGTDEQLARLLHDCVAEKRAGHGSDNIDFVRPDRAMYQIGG